MIVSRGALVALVLLLGLRLSTAWAQSVEAPLSTESPRGAALVERLRGGGLVLFFRHADTTGEPCDRDFRVGERSGQRNISAAGRAQAAEIGRRIAALGIPVTLPVLAGPVFRARDTAELAFGVERVSVIDGLLSDDYAGERLDWVLAEHRRLLSAPVPDGLNRVLVGHRGPIQMLVGSRVTGTSLPEGGALVVEPRGGVRFTMLGVLALVPMPGDGNPRCG